MHEGLIWFILIGIAAGWLAGQLMKGGGFGLVGDLVTCAQPATNNVQNMKA